MARKQKINYRRIYEHHHGSIGRDAEGRSLEVHHINGNHTDNRIENLKLVTIQEHYDIHYSQGDWGACLLMSDRMKISPKERSELASKFQLARSEAGNHNLQKRTDGSSVASDRVDNGTNPFLGSEVARKRNEKRIRAGTHNWIKRPDGTSFTSDLVEAGTHHFVTNNPVQKLLASGNHASKIKLSCRFCKNTTSKNQFTKLHSKCE